MASSSRSLASSYTFDDKDLEDADLWAVIDSAAASLAQKNTTTTSSSSGKSPKPLAVRYPNFNSPPTPVSNAPPPSKLLLQVANHNNPRSHEESPRPSKIARSRVLCEVNSNPMALVTTTSHRSSNPIIHSTKFSSPESYYSPGIRQSTTLPESPRRPMALVTTANRDLTPVNHSTKFSSPESYLSPGIRQQQSTSLSEVVSPPSGCVKNDPVNEMRHSLSGSFPSATLFKEYQNTAMAVGTSICSYPSYYSVLIPMH